MKRYRLSLAVAAVLVVTAGGCHVPTAAERAADPIVQKNAEARGGLAAWRNVKTLAMSGLLDAGHPRNQAKLAASLVRSPNQVKARERQAVLRPADSGPDKQVQLPFIMELKRPRMTRMELTFQGQTAVQVFDGKQGWKLRPYLGRRELEGYTDAELRQAAQQADLDGPLLDAGAKGYRVALLGTDRLEGHDVYKLEVSAGGQVLRHVWVDAESYLDVRVDGVRTLDGKPHTMFTAQRDFKAVDGLMIPHLLETTVLGVPGSEKIIVQHVVVNPQLPDDKFTKIE